MEKIKIFKNIKIKIEILRKKMEDETITSVYKKLCDFYRNL